MRRYPCSPRSRHGCPKTPCQLALNDPAYELAANADLPGFLGFMRRASSRALGLLTDPPQAEAIVAGGQAGLVLLARQMLREPYWPLHAGQALGAAESWPVQYLRARPAR